MTDDSQVLSTQGTIQAIPIEAVPGLFRIKGAFQNMLDDFDHSPWYRKKKKRAAAETENETRGEASDHQDRPKE